MALPKIEHILYDVEIPTLGRKVKIRPFTVKEEKILTFANSSGEFDDAINAIEQVVNNCIIDDIDSSQLAVIDIEYIFIKLRSISVDNVLEAVFKKGDESIKIQIDLDKIKSPKIDKNSAIVELGNGVGVKMRYPLFSDLSMIEELKSNEDKLVTYNVIKSFIVSVFDSDTVYDEFTEEEIDEFLDQLKSSAIAKILEFFKTLPQVVYEEEIKLKDGTKETIKLEGIKDFFI